MNQKLQSIITQLNSSQVVLLLEFISALEQEPNIVFGDIFNGVLRNSNTIDFKNCYQLATDLQGIVFFQIENTDHWKFSISKYSLENFTIYLNLVSTNNSQSKISAIIIGNLSYENINLPIIISKYEERIIFNLYLDKGNYNRYNFEVIESLFDLSLLKSCYPPRMQSNAHLDCSSISLNYNLITESINYLIITSKAPDWTIGDTLRFDLKSCTISANIPLPYSNDQISFEIMGNLELDDKLVPEVKIVLSPVVDSNAYVIIRDGEVPITELSRIVSLFQYTNIVSFLPANLGYITDLSLNQLLFIYDVDQKEVNYYSLGISFADENTEWQIIPGVLSLKQLGLNFSYSPLYCDVTGLLSLSSCNLNFFTSVSIDNDNPSTQLLFRLNEGSQSPIPINLSDIDVFGIKIFDIIPSIDSFNFNLHNLLLWVEIAESASLKNFSIAFSTESDWTLLPKVVLKKLFIDLDFINNEEFKIDHGFVSGEFQIDDSIIPIGITVPESGDWMLAFAEGNESTDELSVQEGYSAIPIPGLQSLCSLLGITLLDKVPSALTFDDISLKKLHITFPKPTTQGIISTAYFELRLTEEWSLTNAFSLNNIIFQCGIDFTGETTYAFNILGKVTLATIDLSTVVTKTADGSWSFSIALDPDEEVKPSVKDMLSDLLSFNLPAAVPDVEISEMELSGNIAENSDNTYQYKIHITDAWDLEPLTKLNINLEEVIIEGSVSGSDKPCKITGIINLGEEESKTKLQLTADLTADGYKFTGGLGEDSTLTIPDILKILPAEIPGISTVASYLDSFEISKLDVIFEEINNATSSSFNIEGGFDFDLFGKNCKVLGIVSFTNTNGTWELKELSGEFSILSLRFKIGFLNGIELELYLPNPDNPDNPEILLCTINDDKSLSISLTNVGIFSLILKLVNLMIPGMKLDFPSPWDKLDHIKVSVTLKINMSNPDSITASIDIPIHRSLPLLEINSIGIECNFNEFDITVDIAGELFGEDKAISFKPISEDPPTPAVPMGLLDLRYAGFGRHVSLNEQTNYTSMREVIQKLRDAFEQKPNSVVGSNIFGALGYNSESDWLIGFDFTVAQFLRLSVIFNDPILYGMLIRLDGPAAGMFSGFEFEILYQRLAAGIGAYRMKLELPAYLRTIELGAVSLTLPFIGIDIYTNGNFKLDLGFPYQSNFERSFALSLFPFYGKGGFYFASLNGATSTSVPRIRNGSFKPVIEFGIGLQGLGKVA